MPDPERMLAGLPPLRRDAQPAAGVHEGRLRRPDAGARLEPGLRRELARRAAATRRSPPRSSARSRSWPRAGSTSRATPQLHQVDVWTSHEGLLLDYEEGADAPRLAHRRLVRLLGPHALDRRADARRSTARTSSSSPASTTRSASSSGRPRRPTRSLELCERLNPERIPGRLTLIARMGAGRVEELLPPLLRAVARGRAPGRLGLRPDAREQVRTAGGRKTRHFDAIMAEIEGFFARLPRRGRVARRRPPRVHGRGRDRVPRRLRGARRGAARRTRYETLCDPRLNAPPVARPRVPARRADARRLSVSWLSRLAIVGTGLIGASVGLAARARGRRARRRLGPGRRGARARGRARRGRGRRERSRRRSPAPTSPSSRRRSRRSPRWSRAVLAAAAELHGHRRRLDEGGRRAPRCRARASSAATRSPARRRTARSTRAPSSSRARPGS